jgi:hypothetical protein
MSLYVSAVHQDIGRNSKEILFNSKLVNQSARVIFESEGINYSAVTSNV